MKTKIIYKVEREDGFSQEFDNLKEAQKFSDIIKYRRTGKSYRAFFLALSINVEDSKNIVLFYDCFEQAKYQFGNFCEILDSLHFQYSRDIAALKVENKGRTFRFCSIDDKKYTKGLDCFAIYDLDKK